MHTTVGVGAGKLQLLKVVVDGANGIPTNGGQFFGNAGKELTAGGVLGLVGGGGGGIFGGGGSEGSRGKQAADDGVQFNEKTVEIVALQKHALECVFAG